MEIRQSLMRLTRLPRQLNAIVDHPLNRNHRLAALGRWARWQIGSRLVSGEVFVPFVEKTVLVAHPGLTGVTGNIYFGLAEYEEMAFALHLLRPGDLFVDVGANCGSYTVLASGAAGAESIAVEPIPATADMLELNVRVNGLTDLVTVKRCGLAAAPGSLGFTVDRDTTNRVARPGEHGERRPVDTLDRVLKGRSPTLIKIDVEGYESEVLRGATETLRGPGVKAVIVEINDSRLIEESADAISTLRDSGFQVRYYDPLDRKLTKASSNNVKSDNALCLRDVAWVQERLREAPRYRIGTRVI